MSGAYVNGVLKAYAEGKKAASNDKSLGCNPYKRPDYRKSWIDGWHDVVNNKDALVNAEERA